MKNLKRYKIVHFAQRKFLTLFFIRYGVWFFSGNSVLLGKKIKYYQLLVFTWRHGGHVGVLLTKEFWLFLLFGTPTWPLCLLFFVSLGIVWKPRIVLFQSITIIRKVCVEGKLRKRCSTVYVCWLLKEHNYLSRFQSW